MNPDQTMAIRIAICDTIDHIRAEPPEPTRTALQAHLEALLKEELRALTGQAPEGDLIGKLNLTLELNAAQFQEELARIQEQLAALRKDPAQPAPWYPDDSGDWVEGHPRDLPPDTPVHAWLYVKERNGKYYNPSPDPLRAGDLSPLTGIVAYKVVKP